MVTLWLNCVRYGQRSSAPRPGVAPALAEGRWRRGPGNDNYFRRQRQLSGFSLFLGLFSLFHPVAGDVQLNDDAVMHQAVDGRGRGHRVFKDGFPFGKG